MHACQSIAVEVYCSQFKRWYVYQSITVEVYCSKLENLSPGICSGGLLQSTWKLKRWHASKKTCSKLVTWRFLICIPDSGRWIEKIVLWKSTSLDFARNTLNSDKWTTYFLLCMLILFSRISALIKTRSFYYFYFSFASLFVSFSLPSKLQALPHAYKRRYSLTD